MTNNINQHAKLNIKNVVFKGLCLGCGTCAGVCPQKAITLELHRSKGYYLPIVDAAKCSNCGLCYDVCPGHSVDFKSLNREIFDQDSRDVLLGVFRNCYTGYSGDTNIRYNSASGGAITTILLYALEKGIINGALVTGANPENPLQPRSFIARTREEIISASKSKYCPVPVNIALEEILSNEEKVAVVGLPCHIQGVRKAETRIKTLKNKIVLHLGLICSHCDTFIFTQAILKQFRINEKEIGRIDYRGKGWPGSITIQLRDGREVVKPISQPMPFHFNWFYAMHRCVLCCDNTSELADISCGDAWLPELIANDKIGTSFIVVRDQIGYDICQNAVREGYLSIKEVDDFRIKQSLSMMQTKKKDIKFWFFLRKWTGRSIPEYKTVFQKLNFKGCLHGMVISFNAGISSIKCLRGSVGILSKIESKLISRFY